MTQPCHGDQHLGGWQLAAFLKTPTGRILAYGQPAANLFASSDRLDMGPCRFVGTALSQLARVNFRQ